MKRLSQGLGVDPIFSWSMVMLIGGAALVAAGRWLAPNPE